MARLKRSRKKPTMVKMAELAVAAPQVIAIRTARMLAAGANPGAVDRAEFSQMSNEKVKAFWESMFGMAAQTAKTNQEYLRTAAQSWVRAWVTPWWLGVKPSMAALTFTPTRGQRNRAVSKLVAAGLAPVHKKATANARRLTRVGKR
jgi:hypothetical protein